MGQLSDSTSTPEVADADPMTERLEHLIEIAPTLPPRRPDDCGVQDGETLQPLTPDEYAAKVEVNRIRYAQWLAAREHR